MATAPKPAHIQVPVNCPHCQTKQIVHVLYQTGFGYGNTEIITCVKCDKGFEAFVPNRIVDGPFLA